VKAEDHPIVVDPAQMEGTSSGYVNPGSIKDGTWLNPIWGSCGRKKIIHDSEFEGSNPFSTSTGWLKWH